MFRTMLKTLNILGMMILIVLATKYAHADTELDYELDAIEESFEGQARMLASKENIDECVLDSTGVCTVETKDLKEKTVKEETPKRFKNSKIVRQLEDGTIVELDGDNYKVVPRTQKRLKKVKVKKRFRPVLIRDRVIKEKVGHDTRLSLLVGHGPSGNVDCSNANNRTRCETENEVTVGIQLMQDVYVNEDYSIHVMGQIKSNRDKNLGIGIGF